MPTYEKLVRDRIPEIVMRTGKACEVRVLAPEDFRPALEAKLGEEVREYRADGGLDELADVLEVVYALAELDGASPAALEAARRRKAAERGAFRERLFLVRVED